MKKRRWNGQTFTSLCTLASFLTLSATGIVLTIQPHGRVAYWTRWQLLGLEKDQWDQLHLISAAVFVIMGGIHVAYNWKPLIRYLSKKTGQSLRYGREIALSGALLIWILVSGIWSLPPLSYLADLSQTAKNAWVTAPELEPPFGHAEMLSLESFCRKQGIPLDRAIQALKDAGFGVTDPYRTLAQIAQSKAASGVDVYAAIKQLRTQANPFHADTKWTAEQVRTRLSGSGLGHKTVAQVIRETQQKPKRVFARLARHGIEAQDNDRIKDLADVYDRTPLDMATLMLVD